MPNKTLLTFKRKHTRCRWCVCRRITCTCVYVLTAKYFIHDTIAATRFVFASKISSEMWARFCRITGISIRHSPEPLIGCGSGHSPTFDTFGASTRCHCTDYCKSAHIIKAIESSSSKLRDNKIHNIMKNTLLKNNCKDFDFINKYLHWTYNTNTKNLTDI